MREQRYAEVHHLDRTGNDHRSSVEATEPVPLAAVVSFDGRSFKLGDTVLLGLDLDPVGVPVVGAVDFCLPLTQTIHQSLEGSVITIPAFPVNESP